MDRSPIGLTDKVDVGDGGGVCDDNLDHHGGDGDNSFVSLPLKVAARGTGSMSIAPTVSTMQRFLIKRKLTICLLISLFRILSTMLMLVTTVMKRMMRMSEHWRACKAKSILKRDQTLENAKMLQRLNFLEKFKINFLTLNIER